MHASGDRSRPAFLVFTGLSVVLAALAVLAFTRVDAAPSFPADPGKLDKVGVVLAPGARGAWDSEMVESPSVVGDGNGFAMAYVGYDQAHVARIGLARSADGIRWRRSSAPILGPSGVPGSPDAGGTTGPVLVRIPGGWVMFYVGLTEAGYEAGRKTINYAAATSLDGPWVRHGVVVKPAGNGWRARAVWHVSVVRFAGTWFMFFNATGANGRESIGYATARALAGPWKVDDRNSPLLAPVGGGWDSHFVGDPDVRREGGRWVMHYYGYDGHHAGDGRAVTSDADFPLGWHRAGLELAPSKPYDAQFAHKPWVTTVDGREFHYYTAVSTDDRRQIALAVGR